MELFDITVQQLMFVACCVMIGGSGYIYLVVLSLLVPSPLAMAQLNDTL